MREEIRIAMRGNFPLFFRKVLKELNPGQTINRAPFIDLLGHKLVALHNGDFYRLNINLPPAHGKTTLCSKAFAAWVLGHDPSMKVMVITGSESLCKEIASDVRQILRSKWFRDVFPTRVRRDRTGVFDFKTTDGGGCFSCTIGGNFTGRRADLVIMDDVIDFNDADKREHLAWVRNTYDTKITSRLNHPQTSLMLNVAQRLNVDDLSGHLLKQEGWESIALPLVATRSVRYRYGDKVWHRQKGEQLIPGFFTDQQIKQKKQAPTVPDFETYYQQRPDGEPPPRIRRRHFGTFDAKDVVNAPVLLSVDAGQQKDGRSFSVIQAWCRIGKFYALIDQWREQVDLHELVAACRSFRFKYRPYAILIERAALGTSLISEGIRKGWRGIVPVDPNQQSKSSRFSPHARKFRRGLILLPRDAPWRRGYENEIMEFPDALNTDQVDASSQGLTWMEDRPSPAPRPPRAVVGLATGNGSHVSRDIPGRCILVRRQRFW
jgi:phage terminase large subunit-like protein